MEDTIKKHSFRNLCQHDCPHCEEEEDNRCSHYTEREVSGFTYKQCYKRRDDPVHQLEIREQ